MADPAARVLVVDDNKVNRLLLSRNVQIQGHRAELAENGRSALEMLRREPFDLLLLDIEMPEMDGFAVLEQLKADSQLRDLPVIVTSSVEGLAPQHLERDQAVLRERSSMALHLHAARHQQAVDLVVVDDQQACRRISHCAGPGARRRPAGTRLRVRRSRPRRAPDRCLAP